MFRNLPNLLLLCSMVFAAPSVSAQVIVLPLTENVALIEDDGLETRDYSAHERVVLIPNESKEICLIRPDLSLYDTLINLQCNPISLSTVILLENCVTIQANPDATPGKETVCLEYIDIQGESIQILIEIEIVQPILLPFFEDFANTYKVPNPAKWTDRHVFVNNTMAYRPPSNGVATFDGLNSNGSPYGGGFGRADYLTSTYIDLSAVNPNETIYMSYFAQPKGLTYFHQLRDSFLLEMKDATGQWITVASHKGIDPVHPNTYVPEFEQYQLVIEPQFRHNAFQFRFVNYNYRQGVYAAWHLDYIQIAASQVPSKSLNDIAFIAPPNGILKKYSAMPYKQLVGFQDQELVEETRIELFNHFLNTDEDIFNTKHQITEETTGTVLLDKELVNTVPQLNPPRGFNLFVNNFDPGLIASSVASFPPDNLPLVFITSYEFDQDQEVSNDQKRNNYTSTRTMVGHELAYDDGSAEINIAAEANISTKAQIAVKYHLNTGDTLRAVRFHFPRLFNDITGQLFNLKVWVGSLDKDPADYLYQLRRPIYADTFYDTLHGFTTYELVNDLTKEPAHLYIPPGDFYIGWQQFSVPSGGQFIPVGFDRNYIGGDALTYYKSDGAWRSLAEIGGSELLKGIPMIRAVFENAWTTSNTHSVKETDNWQIAPNPTTGLIKIYGDQQETKAYRIQIFDLMGQLLYTGQMRDEIDIAPFAGNIFLVRIMNNQGELLTSKKVIKM